MVRVRVEAFDLTRLADPNAIGEPGKSQALHKTLREAESLVANIEKRKREKGGKDVETNLVENPADVARICAAETRKSELVVIGGRGRGTWKGALLGNVGLAVSQRALGSALIVRQIVSERIHH
jgi:nucleotide-binding universal stress UspA family protein